MNKEEQIEKAFLGDPMKFLEELKSRAYELEPDYPYAEHTAYEYLWAISEGSKGVSLACDDWVDIIKTVKFIGDPSGNEHMASRNNHYGYGKTRLEAISKLIDRERDDKDKNYF